MKVSYRAMGVMVLAVFLAEILTPEHLLTRPLPAGLSLPPGGVSFDLCAAWEQIGWICRLSSLVWIVTFIMILVQGLRNRTVGPAIALVSLTTLAITTYYQRWHFQHCYSNIGIASVVLWVSAVSLMCIQQALQRPPPVKSP
ncbi:MAG TPA: hypothetical protein VIX89_14810 [Bryobacteraceae bacterium]